MSGRLLAMDMACVRMMSMKPATLSAVLLACTHISAMSGRQAYSDCTYEDHGNFCWHVSLCTLRTALAGYKNLRRGTLFNS